MSTFSNKFAVVRKGFREGACFQCGEVFHTRQSKRKYCSDCANQTANRYHADNPYRKYGMTFSAYTARVVAQNFRCAICGADDEQRSGRRLVVDHCHATGRIRGLLCGHCNSGLGMFKDKTENLRNAIQYLEGSSNDIFS